MVFSGASTASPRWARTRGDAGEKNPSSAPPRACLLRGRPGIGPVSEAGTAEEATADSLDRLGELRRDDPELAGLTFGDLGKRQQVLVRQQGRIRIAIVDRLEHGRDRTRFTFGAQHCSLGEALRLEDRRLARAF